MLHQLVLLAFIFASIPSLVFAGPVETNVRLCGVSSPYQRYGERALGITGNSSTGLKNQFFRMKGYLGVEENMDAPDMPHADVVADFYSALQIAGMKLCVRGNLETVERPDNVYYFFSPKGFQVTEPADVLLLPSQLAGLYQFPLASGPTLTLRALEDTEDGHRFHFAELPALIKPMLGAPCGEIDLAIADPSIVNLVFTRADKNMLMAEAVMACSASAKNDTVYIRVEFKRAQGILGLITVDRAATNKAISLEIKRL